MDSEKIIQDLNRCFAAPMPEFYKRRIIFWYEEDQEFVDKLDEIEVSGAKKVLPPITSAADLGTVPPELIGCFNLIFLQ